jgi:hypothetical protein
MKLRLTQLHIIASCTDSAAREFVVNAYNQIIILISLSIEVVFEIKSW